MKISIGNIAGFVVAALAVTLAGCGDASETCNTGGTCPSGASYLVCSTGSTCLLRLGANSYGCNSCSDCTAAAREVLMACQANGNGYDLSTPPQDFSHPLLPDFSIVSTLDLSVVSGTDTCSDIVACTNACATAACNTACIKKGSVVAQNDYKALTTCIDTACPQNPSVDGGTNAACSYDSITGNFINKAACDACVSNSQMTGGPCVTTLATCNAN